MLHMEPIFTGISLSFHLCHYYISFLWNKTGISLQVTNLKIIQQYIQRLPGAISSPCSKFFSLKKFIIFFSQKNPLWKNLCFLKKKFLIECRKYRTKLSTPSFKNSYIFYKNIFFYISRGDLQCLKNKNFYTSLKRLSSHFGMAVDETIK